MNWESNAENLKIKVDNLREKRKAAMLAHNYQAPEVQDVADFVGDSLELARKAVKVDAEVLVFAGVSFMAEAAAILNEDKTILHPIRDAGCPLADFLDFETVKRLKQRYPSTPLVLYVNTSAVTKTYADYIVTSASALELISKLDADTILFGPDKNLASYVANRTDKKIIPIPSDGYCYVHEKLNSHHHCKKAKEKNPNAKLLVHPEVSPKVQELADYIGSTSQMLKAIGSLQGEEFLLGTEEGHSYRAKKIYPKKKIYPVNPRAICADMKKINLQNIKKSLETLIPQVTINKKTKRKVKTVLERSLEMLDT